MRNAEAQPNVIDPVALQRSEHLQPHLVHDHRFLRLIGLEAWQRLPEAVRRRFSKRITANDSVVYQGHVVETSMNPAGIFLANVTRLIGAPLPLDNGAVGPSAVVVTQSETTAAQNWVRTYPRPKGTTQVITSQKRFQGPTGLEEYVGAGIGMTLHVREVDGALWFQSERYFFELGWLRFYLPRFLSPGQMTIIHRDEDDGRFCFELTLRHALFGVMVNQIARFSDAASGATSGAVS